MCAELASFHACTFVGDAEGGECSYDLVENFRKGCPTIHNDVQCAIWKKKEIENWLNHNSKFKILVTGRANTGKKTLVAGVQKGITPEHDIEFLYFDIPGTNGSGGDLSYIKSMVSRRQEPDMVIFAIKMDELVLNQDDKDAIESISRAFGWRVWKNTMFALTYANQVYFGGVRVDVVTKENKMYYNKIKREFSLSITETLRRCRVQDKIANDIPVLPVGRGFEPQIPSSERKASWVDEFWSTVNKILNESRENDRRPSS